MAEQNEPGVHFGLLNLRIPGDGPEAGHRVSNRVAQSLSRKIPAGMRSHLGALSIRVQVPAGASDGAIAEAIAASIVRALGKGTP